MTAQAKKQFEPPFLTKQDVARLSGLSVRTVERLTAIGILNGFHPGGRRMVRYHRAEIMRWIADGCPKQQRRPARKSKRRRPPHRGSAVTTTRTRRICRAPTALDLLLRAVGLDVQREEHMDSQKNSLDLLTLGEVADRLGCQLWRLDRVFERGLLPEPERVGRNRVVRESDLPAIRQALEKAGYLKEPMTRAGK